MRSGCVDLDDLLKGEQVKELVASPKPEADAARDLRPARKYAARYVLDAMKFGYENGFERGLENDARLFGEIAAAPSGQEWIKRFINKDPQQSAFLTLLD